MHIFGQNDRLRERQDRARRHDAAQREKKLKRQLEGLAKAEKAVNELLARGTDALSDAAPQSLERLSVELGNCGLTGARDAFARVAMLERRSRQEGADMRTYRAELLNELASLRALLKESRAFLAGQLSSERYALEEPVLYELLGGEWDGDELAELGSCRKDARLVQLSFDISYDEARRERVERGFWLDVEKGDILRTATLRAAKPLDGGASDDTCFELLAIPTLYEAPGAPCPRVWWDGAETRYVSDEVCAAIRAFAEPRLADVAKAAAERIREPLLPDYVPALVRVGAVGTVSGTLVLEDIDGGRIELCDRRSDGAARASARRLTVLPEPPATGDALFGLVFYDASARRYCLHPYSLVRADEIVRLQF